MSVKFEYEVQSLIKSGVSRDYAMLIAASKLEDKTILYQVIEKIKKENELMEEELTQLGFQKTEFPPQEIKQELPIKKTYHLCSPNLIILFCFVFFPAVFISLYK